MRIVYTFKRILLTALVAVNLATPGLAVAGSTAMIPADGMGHPQTDITNCLDRHQGQVATFDKENKEFEQKDKDAPIPPVLPYFVVFQQKLGDVYTPIPDQILSPSFVPPDIVILMATIRV